eukprot:TRINITY_DN79177_c0_g1_i1.p1 TRINITY_DN79177_c0_g1~~TRINITY_DN79177_c0_g1_i1.p1  ORF type:complete len:359 (-),score=68.04 TRINITY_DN79177_c0_g1_i1:84-1160(-)
MITRQHFAETVRLVCSARGIACDLVKATIFRYLDDLPQVLVAGSLDGDVCFWHVGFDSINLLDTQPVRLKHPSPVHSVVVGSSACPFLGTGTGDGRVRLYSIEGKPLGSFQAYDDGPVYSIQLDACVATGTVFCATATGGATVIVSDSEQVQPFAHLWRLDGLHVETCSATCLAALGHHLGVNGIILDVRNSLLATASDDRTAGIFDFSGRRLATCREHESFVWEVAMAAELSLVATACEDKAARLFDLRGNCLAAFHCAAGCCEIALEPNAGALLATSADGTLRLWSLEDHRVLGIAGDAGEVHGAASLLNYGRVLCGNDAGELVEWEVRPGAESWCLQEVRRVRPFTAAAVTVAIR